jgi:large subunit ribosomal protein L22
MADYKYAYEGKQENIAKAVIRDSAISTKTAIEMSNFLRGKSTKAAKAALERIIEKKQALPYKRFTNGLGHKKGPMAAGRYPQAASKAFLGLIENAEANASNKGLADDLIIKHIVANKASTPYHYGRQRRRKTKRTHVEIVLIENEKAERKPKKAKQPETHKAEEKPAAKPHAEAKKPVKAAKPKKQSPQPSEEKETAQP